MFETRKHTCDVDMRRAHATGALESIEDTLKVHMYWLNVQGFRVKAFVVCCLLFVVCCLMFVDYRNFLSSMFHWALWPVFGGLWEPLGCLGCLRTAMGLHLSPFGGLLGRLWGVIGLHLSPLGVHWGAFGSHWGSLRDHFLPKTHLAPFYVFFIFVMTKSAP